MRGRRWFVLAAFALVSTSAAIAGPHGNTDYGDYGGGPTDYPRRLVRVEAVAIGPAYYFNYNTMGLAFDLLKVTCQWNRFRLGAAVSEVWGDPLERNGYPFVASMIAPVYVGYDLLHRPARTWFFYGAVPDVYVEAGVDFIFNPSGKAMLVCDLDYYGLGLRAEAGACYELGGGFTASAALQVRLLTFGFGF